MLRVAAVVVLALLAMSMLTGTFFANNAMYGGQGGMGKHMGIGGNAGYYPLNGIHVVLTWVMHLLWVFLIVALAVGGFLLLKKASYARIPAPPRTTACQRCGQHVADEFRYCPNCKFNLKSVCQSCDRPVRHDWQCCPYCGTKKNSQ